MCTRVLRDLSHIFLSHSFGSKCARSLVYFVDYYKASAENKNGAVRTDEVMKHDCCLDLRYHSLQRFPVIGGCKNPVEIKTCPESE